MQPITTQVVPSLHRLGPTRQTLRTVSGPNRSSTKGYRLGAVDHPGLCRVGITLLSVKIGIRPRVIPPIDDTPTSTPITPIAYPRRTTWRGFRWRWLLAFALMGIVALLCVSAFLLATVLRPLAVTIAQNGDALIVYTRADTVASLLHQQGITLGEGDSIDPPLQSTLQPDLVIQIARARVVSLMADGEMQVLRTSLEQPTAILALAAVEVAPDDRLIVDGTSVTAAQLTDWPVPVSSITVQRALQVTIDDDGAAQTITTTGATVGEALYEAGLTLYLADTVQPDIDTPLTANMRVVIRRARPVSIIADGERVETRAQGATVSDALANAGVALVGSDYTIPAESVSLIPGMTIRVVRVEETILTEQAELPYETIYQADAALELDQQQTLQVGQAGAQETVIRVRLENGIEVARTVEATTVTREPQDHIISYGTNVVIRTLNTPQGAREYWRVIRMYATSYHPAALGGDDVTATGRRLVTGIVASNPRVLPYGTEIFVEGYGVGLIADTGGPRRIPLWVDLGYSDDEYRSWSRYVDVYVLTPVPAEIDYILPGS
jgi:resuscitation-promoting factor RpfB